MRNYFRERKWFVKGQAYSMYQAHLSSHDLCIVQLLNSWHVSSFELELGLQRNLQQDLYITNSGVDEAEVEKLWSQKAGVPRGCHWNTQEKVHTGSWWPQKEIPNST